MLLLGIEVYHILNIKHYSGAVFPLIEAFTNKIYPENSIIETQMDPTEMV